MKLILMMGILLSGTVASAQCNIGGGCGNNNFYGCSNVAYSNSLHYVIMNQGVEQSRFYIKAKFGNDMYTIPVINGNMPEITRNNLNELILDYKKHISYTNAYGGEYVKYELLQDRDDVYPQRAVKSYDEEQEIKVKGLKTQSVEKKRDRQGMIRPSDEDIDKLFKKPSEVK